MIWKVFSENQNPHGSHFPSTKRCYFNKVLILADQSTRSRTISNSYNQNVTQICHLLSTTWTLFFCKIPLQRSQTITRHLSPSEKYLQKIFIQTPQIQQKLFLSEKCRHFFSLLFFLPFFLFILLFRSCSCTYSHFRSLSSHFQYISSRIKLFKFSLRRQL